MEAVIHADDFKGTLTVQTPVFTRQFEGALVGLGPAIGEEGAHTVALASEQFGKLDLARVVIEI